MPVLRTAVPARALAALAAAALVGCGTFDAGEPAPDGFYRVRQGDTMYSVARSHKRSVQELAQWNAIPDADRIETGQLLRIRPPASAGASSAASAGAAGTAATSAAPRAASKPAPARPPARQAEAPAGRPAKAIALQWPTDGKVTGRYAPPGNKGVRIAAGGGSVVKAAAPGRAIHVGMLRGYGMLVILKHGDDWLTVYGNLGRPTVKEGAQVATGQEVGRMGSGAGELHFEVRGNGRPINPLTMLPERS